MFFLLKWGAIIKKCYTNQLDDFLFSNNMINKSTITGRKSSKLVKLAFKNESISLEGLMYVRNILFCGSLVPTFFNLKSLFYIIFDLLEINNDQIKVILIHFFIKKLYYIVSSLTQYLLYNLNIYKTRAKVGIRSEGF